MKKKLITAMILLTTVAALTACGGNNQTKGDGEINEETKTAEQQDVQEADAGESAQGAVQQEAHVVYIANTPVTLGDIEGMTCDNNTLSLNFKDDTTSVWYYDSDTAPDGADDWAAGLIQNTPEGETPEQFDITVGDKTCKVVAMIADSYVDMFILQDIGLETCMEINVYCGTVVPDVQELAKAYAVNI